MRLGFLKDRLGKVRQVVGLGGRISHSHDFSLLVKYMGVIVCIAACFFFPHSVVFSFFLHSRVIFLA